MNKLLLPFSRDNLPKLEKAITLFIYYGIPAIILIVVILASTLSSNVGYSWQGGRGEYGLNLLMLVLFIKPISILAKKYLHAEVISIQDFIKIVYDNTQKGLVFLHAKILHKDHNIKHNSLESDFGQKLRDSIQFLINSFRSLSVYLMRFRRQLGVAAFLCILAHGMLWEIFRIRQNLPLFFNIGNSTVITGNIGLLALLIGAITSNNYSIKLLKRNWKKVQMVAYVAFFFAALHTGNIGRVIVYAIIKFFELKELGTIKNITIESTKNRILNIVKICKNKFFTYNR